MSDDGLLVLYGYFPLGLALMAIALSLAAMRKGGAHLLIAVVLLILLVPSAFYLWAMTRGGYPSLAPHVVVAACLIVAVLLNVLKRRG